MEMNNVFSKNLGSSTDKSVSRRKGIFISIVRVLFARKESHCSGVSLVNFKERRHGTEPDAISIDTLLIKQLTNYRAAWGRG